MLPMSSAGVIQIGANETGNIRFSWQQYIALQRENERAFKFLLKIIWKYEYFFVTLRAFIILLYVHTTCMHAGRHSHIHTSTVAKLLRICIMQASAGA